MFALSTDSKRQQRTFRAHTKHFHSVLVVVELEDPKQVRLPPRSGWIANAHFLPKNYDKISLLFAEPANAVPAFIAVVNACGIRSPNSLSYCLRCLGSLLLKMFIIKRFS
mmetsp:Transcript_14372/g.20921  ORF Transcript_14372/g.20921 Transcript_14372/m.20921 type:complete len:110 (+) Transcript_14372:1220-1549(+)